MHRPLHLQLHQALHQPLRRHLHLTSHRPVHLQLHQPWHRPLHPQLRQQLHPPTCPQLSLQLFQHMVQAIVPNGFGAIYFLRADIKTSFCTWAFPRQPTPRFDAKRPIRNVTKTVRHASGLCSWCPFEVSAWVHPSIRVEWPPHGFDMELLNPLPRTATSWAEPSRDVGSNIQSAIARRPRVLSSSRTHPTVMVWTSRPLRRAALTPAFGRALGPADTQGGPLQFASNEFISLLLVAPPSSIPPPPPPHHHHHHTPIPHHSPSSLIHYSTSSSSFER